MRKRESTQGKQEGRRPAVVLHSSQGQRVLSSDGSQHIILLHLALSALDCGYLCRRLIRPAELQACGSQNLPLSSLGPLHVGLALNKNPVTVG